MTDALPILWSPVRFMKKRLKGDIRLAAPFVIFVGALAVLILDMTVMYGRIMDRLPPRLLADAGVAHLGYALNLLAFAIAMFLFWVLGAGILACLAILLDGEGEYRRLLELTGLAHLPVLLFALAGLVIALTYKPAVKFERLFENRDFKTMTHAQKKDFEAELTGELKRETTTSTFQVFTALRYATNLWMVVLCVVALAQSFKLSYLKSGLSVTGMLVLYVVLEAMRAKFTSF